MLAIGCCLALGPQAPDRPTSRPGSEVRTDGNGWPVVSGASDTGRAEAGVVPAAPAAPPVDPGSLESPLRDIWRKVGRPDQLAAQLCAHAQIKLHVFDPSGRRVGERILHHEADLRHPRRDRVEFPDSRRVFGRDGAASWAMVDNVLWHSHEKDARELLEIMGVLLRAPWVFADARYRTYPAETIDVGGEKKVRVRIEARLQSDDALVGPVEDVGPRDRFALICSPGDMRPEELWFRLAGSGVERRVQLLDYRALPPDLQVPVRRLVLAHDGRRLMEVEVVNMQFRLDIPVERFRPPVRERAAAAASPSRGR